jgi:hypothetical protein
MTKYISIATSKDWIYASPITINLFDTTSKLQIRTASTSRFLGIIPPWKNYVSQQMSLAFDELENVVWENQFAESEPEDAMLLESHILQDLLSEIPLTKPIDHWAKLLHDL